jgi:hypothetical protein
VAPQDKIKVGDKTYAVEEILQPWQDRKDAAIREREAYLPQVRINRMFAAGKQHLDVNHRDGRVMEALNRMIAGVQTRMITSDKLGQYLLTAIGRMAGNDYRPNFLAATEDENAAQITQQINDAFGWGWENEWQGDKKVMALLRLLVIDGTGIVRCRYDRKVGELLGDVPVKDGRPILDKELARKYVADTKASGGQVGFARVRAGKVVWEMGSLENYLWPAGQEDPDEFPWEIIVRPVYVREIKARYGDMAEGVDEETLEASSSLTGTGEDKGKMSGKALVYTAYEKPSVEHEKGRTVIFTNTNLLNVYDSLPYDDHPKGPRSGVHTFRWQVIPGRFPGKAFIENGIGAQKVRNKRLTQIDAIIDRNMPKVFAEEESLARPRTGEPMEVIPVRPGAPLPQVSAGVAPGAWMLQDVKLQDENIESALGMRSITLGQPPQGVSAYSAMALLTENDSLKLDPIAQELRMQFVELSWDTMEAMRNWPKDKQMEIAGPNGALRSFLFDKNEIPDRYLVTSPRQGALPRSQAAELQKINDVWNAAAAIGKPLPLDWYVQSLNAGKMQDLPASLANVSKHKAELENIVMFHTHEAVPVSPEDDDLAHGEIHRAFQQQMAAMRDQGDESAGKVYDAIEAHMQEHLASAQDTTQGPPSAGAGPEVTGGPQGSQPGSASTGRPPDPGSLSLPNPPQLPNVR